MLDQQTLISFQKGLHILEQVHDFASMSDTINKMISIVPPLELNYARDAIAQVIRSKQAFEVHKFQAYPQMLYEIDNKYRDLYVVLRYAKPRIVKPRQLPSIVAPPAASSEAEKDKAVGTEAKPEKEDKTENKVEKEKKENQEVRPVPPVATRQIPPPPPAPAPAPTAPTAINVASKNQLGLIPQSGNPFAGLVIDWVKNNKVTLFASTAVAGTLGGAYWLYKHLTNEIEDTKTEDTTFDRTIKSIQKYKAFSQIMKNPDMSNIEEFLSGKPVVVKKKKPEKKEEKPAKTSEWDSEERTLMKDMDQAFGSLSQRPNLDYKLPQLPAPKNIDPLKVLGDKENDKKEKRRDRPEKSFNLIPLPKKEKSIKPKLKEQSGGEEKSATRLVPIIKRTKKIKKITA